MFAVQGMESTRLIDKINYLTVILNLVCFSVDDHDVKHQMYIKVVLTDIVFNIIVRKNSLHIRILKIKIDSLLSCYNVHDAFLFLKEMFPTLSHINISCRSKSSLITRKPQPVKALWSQTHMGMTK